MTLLSRRLFRAALLSRWSPAPPHKPPGDVKLQGESRFQGGFQLSILESPLRDEIFFPKLWAKPLFIICFGCWKLGNLETDFPWNQQE